MSLAAAVAADRAAIDEVGNIVVQGLGGGASHALLLCPQ